MIVAYGGIARRLAKHDRQPALRQRQQRLRHRSRWHPDLALLCRRSVLAYPPIQKRVPGIRRRGTPAVEMQHLFIDPTREWMLNNPIGQWGHAATPNRQLLGMGEDARAPRRPVLPLILVQILAFHPRHIHPSGTLGLARFTLHAQLHHRIECFVRKTARAKLTRDRHAQCIGPATGRIGFIGCGPIRRTHDTS